MDILKRCSECEQLIDRSEKRCPHCDLVTDDYFEPKEISHYSIKSHYPSDWYEFWKECEELKGK